MQFKPTITAVLGGTNTGKTHYAVERMLARASGVIGLPLRLLAREVYERAVREKGEASCALITGEEKIVPPHARYLICTAEAMPMTDIRAGKFASVVIDEVQMIAHKERGHVFTDRMLHARGTEETLLLGANTARPLIEALVPDARFMTRERFSVLSYVGHTKLSRLPKRSVVVAFSAGEVYALAELMRRNYGGAALVMGSLSPRTRNAQAALYQSGEVDYMVATDAIGMGLNLDADHVAFASLRKFDGERRRYLTAAETAQIAGRAGRFRNDGSFGTTGSCLPLDDDMIARIENNAFMPEKYAEWRSTALDFSTVEALKHSLATPPELKGLRRIAPAADETALSRLCDTHDIEDNIHNAHDVKRLWDVCQIPDFPDLGPEAHARLLEDVHTHLYKNSGKLPSNYMRRNISRLDETGGTVEMLSSRLANIRTWTYIAHKTDWILPEKDWVKLAQTVEHRLSDALHNKLVDRFVDVRTSILLKGIGEKANMNATVTSEGQVVCAGQILGTLNGLVFTPVDTESELEAKAIKQTASQSLTPEIDRRLMQIAGSGQGAIGLSDQGEFIWNDAPIGKLARGDSMLKPKVELLCGELGSQVLRDSAIGRLADFIRLEITQKLGCIFALREFAESPTSYKDARAMAHIMYENYGTLDKRAHAKIVKSTESTAINYIVSLGGVFGFYYVYMRDLMKPAPARLLSLLYVYAWEKTAEGQRSSQPFLPKNGMTSMPSQTGFYEEVLQMAGYTRRGPRIIRFDIMNRLAKMLFQARKEREDGRFVIKKEMLSLLGCSFEDFEEILVALKYRKTTQAFTEAEAEAHKKYVLAYFSRRDAILKAKESGDINPDDFPPVLQNKPEPTTDKTHPDYIPKRKRHRLIILNDHVAKPEEDDEGNPIFQTHLELWAYGRAVKPPSRYRPSKHGSNDPDKDVSTQNRKPQRRKPARRNNLSGYADFASATQQAAGSKAGQSEQGQKKRQNKRRKPPGRSTQTTWAPPKQEGAMPPSASPFAALAGLNFDEPKIDKPKAKATTKTKTKPENKVKPKDKKP
ncbi:MAG: ATP-dependent DNA helicase [Robiginitomaculum sp.]|nr:ATP-dependent DNA helicase [Robiginitomaculum sp.]